MQDSRQLLQEVKRRGHSVVLASSAKAERSSTTSNCSTHARSPTPGHLGRRPETKPQPDLVNSALKKARADAKEAVMVGDPPGTSGRGVPKSQRSPCAPVASARMSSGVRRPAVFESVAELLEGSTDEAPLDVQTSYRNVSVISASAAQPRA